MGMIMVGARVFSEVDLHVTVDLEVVISCVTDIMINTGVTPDVNKIQPGEKAYLLCMKTWYTKKGFTFSSSFSFPVCKCTLPPQIHQTSQHRPVMSIR